MADEPTTEVCPRCGGIGRILVDVEQGRLCRQKREQAGLTGREVAKRMGISAVYLSDLERGNRGWSWRRLQQFEAALEGANG